jgi:uncharacterized protein YggU (UPF0235/DUF167 family)
MTAQLRVRVHPGARQEGLVGRMGDGTLKLAVRAAPEGGKANRAVEALLADALEIGAKQVKVVRGGSARTKTVAIEGLSPEEVERRIAARLVGREGSEGESE